MTQIRDLIKRNLGEKVEGVVKVFDRDALASELREYVLTPKIESELRDVLSTFTHVSETLRRGGRSRDVMGIWVSGFFGSGKSHFAKVLGYLLQNDALDDGSGENAIDAFLQHLSDDPVARDLRLRLGEVRQTTRVKTIAFEIKSRQSLTNQNSVGEIMMSEFYRSLGYSENFVIARLEQRLQRRNKLATLEEVYLATHGIPWRSPDARDDLFNVRRSLIDVLPKVDPSAYPSEHAAEKAIEDAFNHERLTAEGIADELVAWVDEQHPPGRAQHLVFLIDELGTFIGDSEDKIGEVNSLAEMIGNKGKGKVWMIATSQLDLEKVVERTNFQPALVARLNARFELRPHLMSDGIERVVSERILKKKPSEEHLLRALYSSREGHLAQLADLRASRALPPMNERAFIDAYPLLPHQIKLAQDIFEALSGFRISGGVRSMISVVMDALRSRADDAVGALVSFDQLFDAIQNDLYSQEYLGAGGVKSIVDASERVPGTPIPAARVLKVLYLIQRVPWVPRVPETLARLLVRHVDDEIATVRSAVEATLRDLQGAGYVSRDEATGEWKFLTERERTIEQAIQELVRLGGTRSITPAAVRRTCQQMCREVVLDRKKLNNYAIAFGASKTPFAYGVVLDGEVIDSTGELEVVFLSPLAPGRVTEIDDLRRKNQAEGHRGRRLVWVAHHSTDLETRFRRYESLVKVTSDKRFTEDTAMETRDALSEKRRERDDLRASLGRELERAFLQGSLMYAGQERDDVPGADMKEPIRVALSAMIPNVFPRFAVADRHIDYGRELKSIYNPSNTALASVGKDLGLFDSRGELHREAPVVAQVFEVLRDLTDEGTEPTGAVLLDARDNRGFKGFRRAPFGWPEDLVPLVLAAGLRSGALYVEQPAGTGTQTLYDWNGTIDLFSKSTAFKKLIFRLASDTLSVDELKRASQALISLGLSGTPESSNALAEAVRGVGGKLTARVDDARRQAQQGLPLPDSLLEGARILGQPATLRDPAAAVKAFLGCSDAWLALKRALDELDTFLTANRHQDFAASRRLAELARHHPPAEDDPHAATLESALKDMDALIAERSVVSRWSDYRVAADGVERSYRSAWSSAYAAARSAASQALDAIHTGTSWKQAPEDRRASVVDRVFGLGKACNFPEVSVVGRAALLDHATRRPLTALRQVPLAMPSYRAQVESELRGLQPPTPDKERQTQEWSSAGLLGLTLGSEADLDAALVPLRALLKQGYKVVIK